MRQPHERPDWMFPQRVFVISDLHLGGRGATESQPDFRMCGVVGQRKLERFIHRVRETHRADCPAHLVINGDFIDFLAEQDSDSDTGFADFTRSEAKALLKLERIATQPRDSTAARSSELGCQEVFAALAQLVDSGAYLTILLGNHDLELVWPRAKARLLQFLHAEQGTVYIPNDGLPLQLGEVYIDHGNRLDFWNRVNYTALTRYTADSSQSFRAPLGSVLVTQYMNFLKERYDFIDLLKPETAAALPLCWFLLPKQLREKLYRERKAVQFVCKVLLQRLFLSSATGVDRSAAGSGEDEEAELSGEFETAQTEALERENPSDRTREDLECLALETAIAENIASMELTRAWFAQEAEQDPPLVSANTGLKSWLGLVAMPFRSLDTIPAHEYSKIREQLWRALRYFFDDDPDRLSIYSSKNAYARSALRLREHKRLRQPCKVAIFGHTHILNRVDREGFTYMNTGTFADLLLIPEAVLNSTPSSGTFDALDLLLRELDPQSRASSASNARDVTPMTRIYTIRRSMPAFADIKLNSRGEVVERRLTVIADQHAARLVSIPSEGSPGAQSLLTLWDLARRIDSKISHDAEPHLERIPSEEAQE